MSKYSDEFKLQVVKYCIEGKHSRNGTAKEFNIPSPTIVKEWIKKYTKPK